MRELWATGWMQNRDRMIAASFLVKHLLIDWRDGEQWFWGTLVDADYGSNATNWQQVPELADLDDPYIDDPEKHDCKPDDHPSKIVAHKVGWGRALDACAQVK